MITFLKTAVAQHTERFFSLRRLEVEAARTLADAVADVGDQLNQIQADLAADADGPTWTAWLESQRDRAVAEGLPAMSERTARDYMALARFRTVIGVRFPELMHLDPACLYPIIRLPEEEIARLVQEGIELPTGERSPVAAATSRQIKSAVKKTASAPAPTPSRAETFRKAMEMLKSLGGLTEAEQAEVAELVPAKEPEPAPAPEAPVQAYTGLLGPVTLQGGRLVLGAVDRTALADDAIAAIRAAEAKCAKVGQGSGTLAAGRKTTARTAVEALRVTVLKWPAMA